MTIVGTDEDLAAYVRAARRLGLTEAPIPAFPSPSEPCKSLGRPSPPARCGQLKVSTVRATSPAFIARKASLMSSRRPRRLTSSSNRSRPCRYSAR
jgi:hypothetical protein